MKRSRQTIALVCGALVVGFSGWVAWAQVGSNGTVLGCVGNSGIIRGIDETTGNCRSGDVALTWYTKTGADAAFAAAGHTHAFDIPRADGPCFDNTKRYVDCGNGTVTDTVTGLIWLQQADCLAFANYAAANQAAAGLKDGDCGGTLTDQSSPGDWRLPTKDEWSATIARGVALGCTLAGPGTAPSLTNDAGTGCLLSGGGTSFAGVASGDYWSSTTAETFPNVAWFAGLGIGSVGNVFKHLFPRVWPVRGGSR